MLPGKWSSVGFLWPLLLLLGGTNPASAQDEYFEYAVKIKCGIPTTERAAALAPGTYFTAINIHNPNPNPIDTGFFGKKFALTAAKEKPGPVSKFSMNVLVSDHALEIDCNDVFSRAQVKGFAKGFAVIQSPAALDVVAVYTAAGATKQVETLHLERVQPRMIRGKLTFKATR
jgi:hypothetical protein